MGHDTGELYLLTDLTPSSTLGLVLISGQWGSTAPLHPITLKSCTPGVKRLLENILDLNYNGCSTKMKWPNYALSECVPIIQQGTKVLQDKDEY